MCGISEALEMSRREWLGMAGLTAAGAAVAVHPGAALATPGKTNHSHGAGSKGGGGDRHPEQFRTRLVLLGVAGGPGWYGSFGTSSALAVGDRNYVVDCGEGAWHQYRNEFYVSPQKTSPGQTLNSLRAVF